MTFEQYWTILLKRWRLIVLCCLLVGAGAAVGSRLTTRLYQSTVLVQVVVGLGSNLSAYNSLLASDQLVQTEAILATSDPVLREVASHYKGLAAEQLAREVTSTPKLNTQLFEIDVVDPSPTRAAALANDIAQTLIKQQLQTTQQSNLLIVQAAMPNPSPVQPNTRLNTGVGLLTGLLLGMLLAALLELLDTQVRAPEALTQLLNWPVLATIWRVNPNEDVVNPTGHNTNVEAFRILRTNIGFSAIDKPLQTLAVTSALDRDGKSVIAANLAIFMAKAGKTTLLIDADMRRPTLQQTFGLSAGAMGLSNAILAFSTATTDHGSSSHKFLTPATPAPSSTTPAVTQISLDPFVYAVDIPNLYIIPSGPLPPNPPELLDSKAMQCLFTALGNCGAEVVIFDTPSLLGLSDASILASKAVAATILFVVFPSQLTLLFQHLSDPVELALRTGAWQTAIRVIQAFPLTGVGLGLQTYLEHSLPYSILAQATPLAHPHNSYLELGAMAGLPVLITFVALVVFALWLALRNWALANVRTRSLLASGITAIIVLSVNSWSINAWTLPPLAATGWMLLGVISSPSLAASPKSVMTQKESNELLTDNS